MISDVFVWLSSIDPCRTDYLLTRSPLSCMYSYNVRSLHSHILGRNGTYRKYDFVFPGHEITWHDETWRDVCVPVPSRQANILPTMILAGSLVYGFFGRMVSIDRWYIYIYIYIHDVYIFNMYIYYVYIYILGVYLYIYICIYILMCVWYGMVWYGMVWYGMVWYGMVWYGMVCIYIYIVNVYIGFVYTWYM